MTDKELIDAFLTGELDEAGMAQLEAELRAHPELVRELADQQQIEQALKVLLGDDAADQQVTVSVLSVLHADPLDSFKKDLLAEVKQEAESRRKQEASAKIPVVPPPAPVEVKPVIELVPPPRVVRRRALPWGVAGAVAAAALVALGVTFFSSSSPVPTVDSHAFLLSVGPGAKVRRGDKVLPARVDMALEPGDRLTTIEENGETRIGFADDPTRIKIKGAAELRFVQGGGSKRVELVKGDCEIAVPPQTEPFTAMTPHSQLRLTTGDVRLLSKDDFARLEVRRGPVSFKRLSDGKQVDVKADEYAVAGKDVDLVAKALNAAPTGDGPAVVAILKKVQGDVYLFTESAADRTPAKSGMTIVAKQAILTEGSRSSVVVEYPDHTLVEIAGDTVVSTLTEKKDKSRKLVTLDRGTLVADVAKQQAGKSMLLRTPQAEVAVLGTRFTLAAEKERTLLQVEEGAVKFTRTEDRKSIEVRSGYFAVAAPGQPLDPAPLPGGSRYIEIDLNAGVTAGDGEWTVENRIVKQSRVARVAEGGTSTMLCRADADDRESLILDVVAQVEQTTPDTAIDRGTWGFGVEAMFRNRSVVLRSSQGPEGTSVFEFPGLTGIPFEHGREGRYRLKFSIERRGVEAVLRGKIWQGDLEPDGWMIENVFEVEGPLTQVGLQTTRCACTFSTFKVKSIKAQEEKTR
jgi:ferric-dicitrate binding protein FerR (iron transport regulator)